MVVCGVDGANLCRIKVEIEEGDSNDNPTFVIVANRDGLVAKLPQGMRKPGWFTVPPIPHKIADKGWQKGSAVR